MARRIDVVVGRGGRVRAEFYGFSGEECFAEAENLKRVLAGLGVQVEAFEVVRKTEAQIAREVGEDVAEEKQVRIRTQG